MPTTRDEPAAWSIDPPVPEGARAVLIFGGAFDPPHRGHIEPALASRDAVGADWLIYVPAARAPLRDAGPIASGADRIEMLRRALAGRGRVSICDVELARGGVSYTLDTLRALRDRLPALARMRLLIGADQAAQFHRWREPDAVVRLAEPVVMVRGDSEPAETVLRIAQHWPPAETQRWAARLVETPAVNASSTRVREALAQHDDRALDAMLDPAVRESIRDRGLYG